MRTPGRGLSADGAAARRTAALAALLCLGLALSAGAVGEPAPGDPGTLAEMSLEDLMNLRVQKVFSASRYEQKVTQAPAAVTIITADEIQRFGYRTLADLLRSVRGLYVTYERNYSNLGLRGFARPGDFNTRVLLLVDGHRMNDNLYDSALIGPEAILDTDLIQRVEVIRGPSSSIYGDNAFFGVIDIITRKGDAIDGLEASAAAGSLGTYRGRLTYGRELANGLDLVLSASRLDSSGQRRLFYPEFDTPETNHGIARNADDESAESVFGHLAYHGLTLSGAYSSRPKAVPTASFGTVFNGGEKTTDERVFFDLKYERDLSPASKLMGRAYYDHYSYRSNYPYDYAAPGAPPLVVVTHDDDYGDGMGAEVQWTRKLGARHTVILGAEIREALHLYQSNFNGSPRVYNFVSDHKDRSVGAYSQAEIALGPHLLINAGLRYDHYDNFGDTINPRLGLIYSPRPETTVKLLYGQAYRAPNAYELYLESAGFNKANPHLKPETIGTYELVVERYLPNDLLLSASVYHYDILDLISQRRDPADGILVFQNVDQVKAYGIELELEGRYAHGLLARVSYALQEAEDARTGEELSNSPREMAKLNLSLPFAGDRLHAGVELQYLSGLRTLDNRRTSGFMLTHATLSHARVLSKLAVSVSVYNLFDHRYAYPGSTGHVQDVIPQDGRTLSLKGTYKF